MRLGVMVLVVLLPSLASARPESDPDTENAHRHFNAGSGFYERMDYENALQEFEAAKRLKPLPAFDYNIGRCHDRLEHLALAILGYQRYVDSNPVDAAEVSQRIAVLKARVADAEAAAVVAREKERAKQAELDREKVTAAPAPETKRPSLVAPIIVGALALVAAAAGTALVVTVAPDYDALASGPTRCARPCDASLITPLEARAYSGYALWGVGGAAAIVDVVLWILAARGSGKEKVSRLPLLLPTLNGVMAEGRF